MLTGFLSKQTVHAVSMICKLIVLLEILSVRFWIRLCLTAHTLKLIKEPLNACLRRTDKEVSALEDVLK